MPFKSEAQRRFMHKNHPEIAQRWEHEGASTPASLPEKKGSKLKKRMTEGKKAPGQAAHFKAFYGS